VSLKPFLVYVDIHIEIILAKEARWVNRSVIGSAGDHVVFTGDW